MDTVTLTAPGKINLGLDVLRKREDGYHEVRMIMQTVDLCDRVLLEKRKEAGIQLMIEGADFLSCDADNLAWKAAALLMREFSVEEGLLIRLRKVIPVAAGMAGGSTDAAAVLIGVNRLFDLGLTKEELQGRALGLGADVPYCVRKGTALSEGIGEILTPLPAPPACHLVIAKPAVSVSTAWVYKNLKAAELPCHPDIDGMRQAISDQDLSGIARRLGNVLETVTIPAHPVIGELKNKMLEFGALGSLMSGSGPTVFGLFDDPERAERCQKAIQEGKKAESVFCSHFYDPAQEEDTGSGE